VDYQGLLDKLSKDPMAAGLAGGLLSGLLGGALGSGKSSKLVKMGALAAVGGLAYKAWQDYQQRQAGVPVTTAPAAQPPSAEGTAFLPRAGDTGAREALGLRILQAMIAAAKADGRIDPAESQQIFERIGSTELTGEDKAFLIEEMGRPLNLDQVVANVARPELAAEIYTASRLVIAEASAAEAAYLQLLAARLGLPAGMAAEIDRVVAEARR
jgi:uncharacterized membrane protein YebE (DUF533 family)